MKQVEKICRSCDHKYTGAPQSKFCSLTCRENGAKTPKFVPEVTLIKKETLSLPFRPAIVKMVEEENTLKGRIKFMLTCSPVLDQVIDNIAKKHKYKEPKHFVSHIEDMLTLYAQD